MKFELIIDKDSEERVSIVAHSENDIVRQIREIVEKEDVTINGYTGDSVFIINVQDVYCFTIIDSKLYAITEKDTLFVKDRLYKVEQQLSGDFIKINQSTIVNRKKIQRFFTTIGAGLGVILKNGYKDYVSRRQLKYVKERLCIK